MAALGAGHLAVSLGGGVGDAERSAVLFGFHQRQAGCQVRFFAGSGPGTLQGRQVLVGLALGQIALDGDGAATEQGVDPRTVTFERASKVVFSGFQRHLGH
ncbi:hypothetical protein FQZ97_807380 [compost metagenome]